jgi:hypothetical protein
MVWGRRSQGLADWRDGPTKRHRARPRLEASLVPEVTAGGSEGWADAPAGKLPGRHLAGSGRVYQTTPAARTRPLSRAPGPVRLARVGGPRSPTEPVVPALHCPALLARRRPIIPLPASIPTRGRDPRLCDGCTHSRVHPYAKQGASECKNKIRVSHSFIEIPRQANPRHGIHVAPVGSPRTPSG